MASTSAGVHFVDNARTLTHHGRPYIVQRLGRFACIVPVPRSAERRRQVGFTWDGSLVRLHALVLPHGGGGGALVVYDCENVVDALVLWMRATLHGWNGVLQGGTSVRRLLGVLLGGTAGGVSAQPAAAPGVLRVKR